MKTYLLTGLLLLLVVLCGCRSETVETCYAEEPAPKATAEQVAAMEEEEPWQSPMDAPAEEPQPVAMQEAPTELTVFCGEYGIPVLSGSYSWRYDNGDGTETGIEACGVHPLDEGSQFPVVPVNAAEAKLEFESPVPDRIVLRSWSADQRGNYDAKAETVPVTDGGFTIEAGRIYELTAEWTDFYSWGGTACYVFSAETE